MRTTEIKSANELWKLGVRDERAARILEIARQHGEKCEPVADGFISVRYSRESGFEVVLHNSAKSRKNSSSDQDGAVAPAARSQYASAQRVRRAGDGEIKKQRPGRSVMARGRAATAEPETTEAAPDYTVYADKPMTSTMEDFAEWLETEVFGGEYPGTAKEKAAFLDGVRLGGTLRVEFSKSPFRIERLKERRAERAAGNGASEEAEEAAAPAKPTRGRAPKPAAPRPAPTKPAARGRGRAAKPAAAAEAPF